MCQCPAKAKKSVWRKKKWIEPLHEEQVELSWRRGGGRQATKAKLDCFSLSTFCDNYSLHAIQVSWHTIIYFILVLQLLSTYPQKLHWVEGCLSTLLWLNYRETVTEVSEPSVLPYKNKVLISSQINPSETYWLNSLFGASVTQVTYYILYFCCQKVLFSFNRLKYLLSQLHLSFRILKSSSERKGWWRIEKLWSRTDAVTGAPRPRELKFLFKAPDTFHRQGRQQFICLEVCV